MVGSQDNILTTCSQLALVSSIGDTNQTYFGWGNNFSSLLPVLENIPANKKRDPLSFVCLGDEGFHAASESMNARSKYNFTTENPLLSLSMPQELISNYTGTLSNTVYSGVITASPLNDIYFCEGLFSIDWLYDGNNAAHNLFFQNLPPVNDTIDALLKLPNATGISKISFSCGIQGSRRWLVGSDLEDSSNTVRVSMLLTLLLVSMSMLFVNGLL